jgi:hypothetical protein
MQIAYFIAGKPDKGPPLSKIIIGTGLDMTDLVSSGPGGRSK